MHFATWDLGDLGSRDVLCEQRIGLIAHEFVKYKLDIIAVSATRTVKRDYPIEEVGGYTFFWNGIRGRKRHLVGFALKDSIACRLTENPVPINEDILTMRIPLKKERFAVLVSAYGPAPDDGNQMKFEFYSVLDRYLSAVPMRDKLFLMGNFNATVGKFNPRWAGVIGKHGHGTVNNNGYSLLQLCAEHNLLITNTVHPEKEQNKTTWLDPRAIDWLLVDYLIVRKRDHYDVIHTRAICGIDFVWSYHRPVRSKLALPINMNIGNPPFTRKKKSKKQTPQLAPSTSEIAQEGQGKEQQKTADLSKSSKKQETSAPPNSSEGVSTVRNKQETSVVPSSSEGVLPEKNKGETNAKTSSSGVSPEKNKQETNAKPNSSGAPLEKDKLQASATQRVLPEKNEEETSAKPNLSKEVSSEKNKPKTSVTPNLSGISTEKNIEETSSIRNSSQGVSSNKNKEETSTIPNPSQEISPNKNKQEKSATSNLSKGVLPEKNEQDNCRKVKGSNKVTVSLSEE